MKLRVALCLAAFSVALAPAGAQDSLTGLAPADDYFGRYNLSVLGIANHIRDAGARIDAGEDPRALLSGPLSFASDAIKAWETQYPADPWIAKNLLALETVYLRVHGDEGFRLASQTEAWLSADYPDTSFATKGRKQLAEFASPPGVPSGIPSYAAAWERFAAFRVPIRPR